MEGWEDPFNRSTYPWGKEDVDLKARFTLLGNLRKTRPSLQTGKIRYLYSKESLLVYARELEDERSVTLVNASGQPLPFFLPWSAGKATDLLTGTVYQAVDGQVKLTLPPYGGLLLV